METGDLSSPAIPLDTRRVCLLGEALLIEDFRRMTSSLSGELGRCCVCGLGRSSLAEDGGCSRPLIDWALGIVSSCGLLEFLLLGNLKHDGSGSGVALALNSFGR